MITLDKVRNYNDLLQIKVLNEDNLKINLSQQDQSKYGFLTLEYNIELLLKMNNIEKSIVVKEDNEVVGYAIVTNKTVYGLNKLFDDLIDRVKTLTYCHNNLNNNMLNVLSVVVFITADQLKQKQIEMKKFLFHV